MPVADKPAAQSSDGVIVVDKPSGPTSHDVVAAARRLLGTPRVGHTGTLDPLATGVLGLVVGRATRLARFMATGQKTYEADITLGVATDTYDVDGAVVSRWEGVLPARGDVEASLEQFRGSFGQVPPRYSAKKVRGVAAHRLARREQPVTLAPARVEVHAIRLVDYQAAVARVEVTASAGFYVRSLAHDLGVALGCGAHLSRLRRTRSGEFVIDEAVDLEQLATDPLGFVRPIDTLLGWARGGRLTPGAADRARHGGTVDQGDVVEWLEGASEGPFRLLDPGGRLIGVVERADRPWPLHPDVVVV